MQRVLCIASDALGDFGNKVMQQMATEAFLRGCNNKEAACFVLVSKPTTIQEACQKMKMVISNKMLWNETRFLPRKGSLWRKKGRGSLT